MELECKNSLEYLMIPQYFQEIWEMVLSFNLIKQLIWERQQAINLFLMVLIEWIKWKLLIKMEVRTFMELAIVCCQTACQTITFVNGSQNIYGVRIENLVYVASSFIILIIKGKTKQNSFFLFLSSP